MTMTRNQQADDIIQNLTSLIDGEQDGLGAILQEVVDFLKHQPTLKILRCEEHNYQAAYVDDVFLFMNNGSMDNLRCLAHRLDWSAETETVDRKEFERRCA